MTEGWFSEYAHLLRNGEMPYRDFSLLLTPLYTLQLAAFQWLAGEGFFALRVLGVCVTCAIALALLDVLRNFFNPWICALTAALAVVYYQSGVAYVGYDFTQFVTFYLLMAVVFLVRSIHHASVEYASRASLLMCGLAGFFSALAFLTKQSNGGVAAATLVLAGILVAFSIHRTKEALQRVTSQIAGLSIPILAIALWLAINGAFAQFIDDVFIGAFTAKGGGSVLGWILHYYNDPPGFFGPMTIMLARLSILVLSMICVSFVIQYAVAYARCRHVSFVEVIKGALQPFHPNRSPVLIQGICVSLTGLAALSLLVFSIAHHTCTVCDTLLSWSSLVRDSVYIWSVNFYLLGVLISFIIMRKTKNTYATQFFVVSLFGVGLVFGNGMSAGLSEIGVYLGYAILFAFLMNAWLPSMLPSMLPATVALAFCVPFLQQKIATPYAWWQVMTPPVRTASCANVTGLFAGLCLPPDEYASIVRVQSDILSNTSLGDRVYVYPHMPVFNLLTDRAPFDNAVVSWFDFMSDKLVTDVNEKMKQFPPAMIVMAEIPENVLIGHEHLFRHDQRLGQRAIIASIAVLIGSGRFERIDQVSDLTGLTIDVYKRRY